jgi:hypothetical protein
MTESAEKQSVKCLDFVDCYYIAVNEYGDKAKTSLKRMLCEQHGFIEIDPTEFPYALKHPFHGVISLITKNDFSIGLQRIDISFDTLKWIIEASGEFVLVPSDDPKDTCHGVRQIEEPEEKIAPMCEHCESKRREVAENARATVMASNSSAPHFEVLNGSGSTSVQSESSAHEAPNLRVVSVQNAAVESQENQLSDEDAHKVMYEYICMMQREHEDGYNQEQCDILARWIVFDEEIPGGVFIDEPQLLDAIDVIKKWPLSRRRKLIYDLIYDEDRREENHQVRRVNGLREHIKIKLAIGEARQAYLSRRELNFIESHRYSAIEIRRIRALFPPKLFSLLGHYGAEWSDNLFTPNQIILDSFTRGYGDVQEDRNIEEDLKKSGYPYEKEDEDTMMVTIGEKDFFIRGRDKQKDHEQDEIFDFNLGKIEKMLPENPRVLYVGSRCDKDVRKAFPDAVYFDLSADYLEEDDVKGDALCMPFSHDSFDLVISRNFDGRALNNKAFHREVQRVLCNRGCFFNSIRFKDKQDRDMVDETLWKALIYGKQDLIRYFRELGFVSKGESRLKQHQINLLVQKK